MKREHILHIPFWLFSLTAMEVIGLLCPHITHYAVFWLILFLLIVAQLAHHESMSKVIRFLTTLFLMLMGFLIYYGFIVKFAPDTCHEIGLTYLSMALCYGAGAFFMYSNIRFVKKYLWYLSFPLAITMAILAYHLTAGILYHFHDM